MLVGPRNRGKTTVLRFLLARKNNTYGDYFYPENTFLYSPTIINDPTLQGLKLENTFEPPTTVEEIVTKIKTDQTALQEADNMDEVLLVLDDVTNIRDVWPVLQDLGFSGRHLNINVLAVAHKMSSAIRGVRTQAQQWYLWKPQECSELTWILDMFAGQRDRERRKIWEAALRRCWADKHQFAFLDFEKDEPEDMYRKGWHDPLFTEEEANYIRFDMSHHDPGAPKHYSTKIENPVL